MLRYGKSRSKNRSFYFEAWQQRVKVDIHFVKSSSRWTSCLIYSSWRHFICRWITQNGGYEQVTPSVNIRNLYNIYLNIHLNKIITWCDFQSIFIYYRRPGECTQVYSNPRFYILAHISFYWSLWMKSCCTSNDILIFRMCQMTVGESARLMKTMNLLTHIQHM